MVREPHRLPMNQLLDACVHCGFCLPACPTYRLWGEEMDSPRGRIYLMRLAADGEAPITSAWVRHFDTCLGCMACMTACPSGVQYGTLLGATRAHIARSYTRPGSDRLYRRLLFALLVHPRRLRLLRALLALYQRSGLQAAVRSAGVVRLLPERLRALEALAPTLRGHEAIPPLTPAEGTPRARVGLLLGCVQRELLSEVNAATVRVLAAEGCAVVAPPEQPCCGALLVHAGEEPPALRLARRTIDAFERAGVEVVITNAAGCGSNVKEYGHLLRNDPAYAGRAAQFAARCQDVTEFLAALGPRATYRPLRCRVAYHDACHLHHAQGVRAQPRALLDAIPDLERVEVPEGTMCCGSAGIYNLVQPRTAGQLADRKAELIASLDADVVATGNPGCLLQLRAALARHGVAVPVVHTIQLLDAALHAEQARQPPWGSRREQTQPR